MTARRLPPPTRAAFSTLYSFSASKAPLSSRRIWPCRALWQVSEPAAGTSAWSTMLGFGLKLPGGFKETHLGRIGR